MALIQLLVVEDDPSFKLDVEIMVNEMGYHNVTFVDNKVDAEESVKKNRPDLVISNTFLNDQPEGLELAKDLLQKQIPVILITSSRDPLVYEEASTSLPVAYLVKPFDGLTLQAAIERTFIQRGHPVFIGRVIQKWHRQQLITEFLFVRKNGSLVKLRIPDIKQVEADGNYCYLHYNGKKYAVKSSLRSIKVLLYNAPFIQVNRSTLLNFREITEISFANSVIRCGTKELSIGNAYRKEIDQWINRL